MKTKNIWNHQLDCQKTLKLPKQKSPIASLNKALSLVNPLHLPKLSSNSSYFFHTQPSPDFLSKNLSPVHLFFLSKDHIFLWISSKSQGGHCIKKTFPRDLSLFGPGGNPNVDRVWMRETKRSSQLLKHQNSRISHLIIDNFAPNSKKTFGWLCFFFLISCRKFHTKTAG